MNNKTLQTIIAIIGIITLIILIVIPNNNKEGFHIFYPHWSWFNYPTRHTTNMIYDIRGNPYCPNFSDCGNWIRKGGNPYYAIPSYRPYFNYSKHYNIDGKIKKINHEDIKMLPHQPWNQPTWKPHHHMMGYYAY